MTDLADLVDGLKREVAVPGTFASIFPNTTDDDLIGTLADGLAETQLDGWMLGLQLDLDSNLTTPDLSLAGRALVVVYSGIRILRNALANQSSHVRYETRGNVYETDRGAGLMKEALADLNKRRASLIDLRLKRSGTSVYTRDGYMIKANAFYAFELGLGIEAEAFNEAFGEDPYTVTPYDFQADILTGQIGGPVLQS